MVASFFYNEQTLIFYILISSCLLLGILIVLPIGGADMPVIIALLNSYSGIVAAFTGFIFSNIALIISGSFFYFNYEENNTYILKTLELNGSVKEGDTLFKMNCVGCHGITARGLVGPDLHSITMRLNDAEIIKQVIEGVTPPMPSFEIDPQNMSNLLTYLHSL